MPKKTKVVTAEDLYDIRPISGCELSAETSAVVFAVQSVDRATEKKFSHLWVGSAERGQAQQFTFGTQRDTAPQWSPDGQWIAFLSNRGDASKPAQLYKIPYSGGEARPISSGKNAIKGSVQSYEWSPDGKHIVACVQLTDADVLARQSDSKKRELGIVSRHITRIHHKFDGRGFLPKERTHLWKINVGTGRTQQLTFGDIHDEHAPTWSPDGQHILFVSNRADDPDFNPGGDDFYLMSANGGDFTRIDTPFGAKSMPAFSPDGQTIAYYTHSFKTDWWKNSQLWVVSTSGGDARSVTRQHDFHVGNASGNDVGGCVTIRPKWSEDGQTLYFQKSEHGSTTLHAINRDGSNLQTVIGGAGVVGAYAITDTHVAYWQSTIQAIGEINVQNRSSKRHRQLSHVNKSLMGRKNLGEIEEVWFKGAANNDLQGWILKPPHFDPAKTYPSIMQMHGGPLAQYANAYMHEFHYLAAHGYVVYFSNPRGGRGYGEQHARAIWNDHGGADVDDVMAWADHVATLPYIDRDRRGITGGSYGGFLVNWIIGQTTEFAAAVTQRSISNRLSSYGSSDINWLREITFDDKTPWEDRENYWRQSPLKHIGNAKTPTLVIHSENDLRCPIEQGEQIFVALKRLGVDSEMVRFPDSSHGLSRIGRTDRRIVRLEHMLRWFDKYLKPSE